MPDKSRAQKGREGARSPVEPMSVGELRAAAERAGLPLQRVYLQPPPEGTLGPFLRAERRKLGLRQVDLAKMAGVHQSRISAYEAGAIPHPDPQRLADLDRALGLPVGTLLSKAGYGNATQQQESTPPAGSLVVLEPRRGLRELTELCTRLTDDDMRSLLEHARFMLAHPSVAPDADDEDDDGDDGHTGSGPAIGAAGGM